ncbi:hypothetical protein HMPREF1210_02331 [Paenisporosarcina sp. HGH0030]|uniref:hypothetical protein n=1 Tax=Paenisporosarcina sp. HGH0030 TaxID=1078085 RepID=UPI00034E8F3A|nr:hypothetical protein [Paenisporosarcina sp. HGH0030]EPD50823.1 hypothetical protein HMPREF1210_02331 [Paenisporosarcina sp. HGH0030]
MSSNREKEIFSDPANTIVSVNGVQVFLDNKFEDETLNEEIEKEYHVENEGKPIIKQPKKKQH